MRNYIEKEYLKVLLKPISREERDSEIEIMINQPKFKEEFIAYLNQYAPHIKEKLEGETDLKELVEKLAVDKFKELFSFIRHNRKIGMPQ